MFTPDALENISKTGNVWGIPLERSRDLIFGCRWVAFRWEQRPKTAFMGRFGGGWQVKLGIQFSRWTYILCSLWIGTLTISSGREEAGKLLKRKLDSKGESDNEK